MAAKSTIITVDVECRRGDPDYLQERAVFGREEGDCYGIPKIIEILTRHNLRAVFFVDFGMFFFNEPLLRKTLEYLANTGTDIALHLHWNAVPQNLVGIPSEVIKNAKNYFHEIVGYPPTAYRGGAYVIDDAIAQALIDHNIHLEFSFHKLYNQSCSFYTDDIGKKPCRYKNLVAIPVTTLSRDGKTKLDINTTSRQDILKGIGENQLSVIFMHSMSFLKPWHDQKTRLSRIDDEALNKFDDITAYMASQGIKTLGLSEIAQLPISDYKPGLWSRLRRLGSG